MTGLKARQRGFEPPTPWSVAKCSIQLSYQRNMLLTRNILILQCKYVIVKYFLCKKKYLNRIQILFLECRRPESNRYGKLIPRDFKSRASANSATPA